MVKGVCGCNFVDDNDDASRTTPEKRCREKHEEKKRPFGEAWMLRSHLGTCSILDSESIAYNTINEWHECMGFSRTRYPVYSCLGFVQFNISIIQISKRIRM